MTSEARLSADEHRRLYHAQILPRGLAKSSSAPNPQAIITGGQPGAGKSRLAEAARREMRAPFGSVVIDADICRQYHPQYLDLVRADPRTAADLTHADAGAWATQLTRDAVQARRNLIIDQTSRDPQAVAQLLEQLRAQGYRTEFRVMAVPYEVSLQRIHARFESQLQAGVLARFSSRQSHDSAYAGLVDTVRVAQASPHVEAIAVYDLMHRRIHRASATPGKGIQSDWPLAAFLRERDRPLSLDERRDLLAKWDRIAAQLARPDRRARADETQTVEQHRAAAARRLDVLVFASLPRDQALKERPGLAAAYQLLDRALTFIEPEQRTLQRERELRERVAHRILAGPTLAPGSDLRASQRRDGPDR